MIQLIAAAHGAKNIISIRTLTMPLTAIFFVRRGSHLSISFWYISRFCSMMSPTWSEMNIRRLHREFEWIYNSHCSAIRKLCNLNGKKSSNYEKFQKCNYDFHHSLVANRYFSLNATCDKYLILRKRFIILSARINACESLRYLKNYASCTHEIVYKTD